MSTQATTENSANGIRAAKSLLETFTKLKAGETDLILLADLRAALVDATNAEIEISNDLMAANKMDAVVESKLISNACANNGILAARNIIKALEEIKRGVVDDGELWYAVNEGVNDLSNVLLNKEASNVSC